MVLRSMLTRPVNADEVATYEADGVVALRGIYPLEWVDQLREHMQAVFDRDVSAAPSDALLTGESMVGSRSDMVEQVHAARAKRPDVMLAVEDGHDPVGRNIVETDACAWHEGLRRHHTEGPLGEIVAALTNSDRVNLYSDQLFLKEPGSGVRTPWHQDKPYWLLKGTKVAVCWVPVDEVTVESGAMGYVAGSHRWGVTFKPSDFITPNGTARIPGLDFEGLSDLPLIDAQPDDYDVRRFEAEPGDVIVHHWMTLHGSTGNISASRLRRAASVRFAGDDVVFYKRPSSPEPFRHSVGLDDGDSLDAAPRFPRVWPKAQ